MANLGTIGLYAKAVVSAAVAAGVTALNAMHNGDLSRADWFTVVGVFVAGLIAVAAVPNFPEGWKAYLKAIISAVVAGLGVLAATLVAGTPITAILILKVLLAAAAALGITYTVPNAAESDPVDPVTRKIRPVRNKLNSPGNSVDHDRRGRNYEESPLA